MSGKNGVGTSFNEVAFIEYCNERLNESRPAAEIVAEKIAKYREYIADIRSRGVSWDSIIEGLKRGGLTASRATLIAAWEFLESKSDKKSQRKTNNNRSDETKNYEVKQKKRKPSPIVLGNGDEAMKVDITLDGSVIAELESALDSSGSIFKSE